MDVGRIFNPNHFLSSYTPTHRGRERSDERISSNQWVSARLHSTENMDQEQAPLRPLEDVSATAAAAATVASATQRDGTLLNIEHQLPPPLEPSPDDNSGLHFGHKSCPPPAYTQVHDPSTLSFPEAPKTELPPIQSQGEVTTGTNHSLPSLSSVTGPQPHLYGSPRTTEPSYSPEPLGTTQWPSMNPLTTFYSPSHVQAINSPQRMDVDVGSNGRASSVSLDDPDVRMAAEALGDLRAGTSDTSGRAIRTVDSLTINSQTSYLRLPMGIHHSLHRRLLAASVLTTALNPSFPFLLPLTH